MKFEDCNSIEVIKEALAKGKITEYVRQRRRLFLANIYLKEDVTFFDEFIVNGMYILNKVGTIDLVYFHNKERFDTVENWETNINVDKRSDEYLIVSSDNEPEDVIRDNNLYPKEITKNMLEDYREEIMLTSILMKVFIIIQGPTGWRGPNGWYSKSFKTGVENVIISTKDGKYTINFVDRMNILFCDNIKDVVKALQTIEEDQEGLLKEIIS